MAQHYLFTVITIISPHFRFPWSILANFIYAVCIKSIYICCILPHLHFSTEPETYCRINILPLPLSCTPISAEKKQIRMSKQACTSCSWIYHYCSKWPFSSSVYNLACLCNQSAACMSKVRISFHGFQYSKCCRAMHLLSLNLLCSVLGSLTSYYPTFFSYTTISFTLYIILDALIYYLQVNFYVCDIWGSYGGVAEDSSFLDVTVCR